MLRNLLFFLLLVISWSVSSKDYPDKYIVTCKISTHSTDLIWAEYVDKVDPILSFGYNWAKIDKNGDLMVKIKSPEDVSKLLRIRTCPKFLWDIYTFDKDMNPIEFSK